MITLTAVGGGYYRVYCDGEEVSKHTAEREAAEKAINLALQRPDAKVWYTHEYGVGIESMGTHNLIKGIADAISNSE